MAYILSGDIGGTKTLLQLSKTGENKPLLQKSYASAAYDDLADMVAEFLQDVEGNKIAAACFALAGPGWLMVMRWPPVLASGIWL
jgi:glucokinase